MDSQPNFLIALLNSCFLGFFFYILIFLSHLLVSLNSNRTFFILYTLFIINILYDIIIFIYYHLYIIIYIPLFLYIMWSCVLYIEMMCKTYLFLLCDIDLVRSLRVFLRFVQALFAVFWEQRLILIKYTVYLTSSKKSSEERPRFSNKNKSKIETNQSDATGLTM